jgi:hypothetical protein
MQQNLDRTQLVPDDGADVPREMGWDDDKQVCIQPIALPMQSYPVISFCCLIQLPALPIFGHVLAFSSSSSSFNRLENTVTPFSGSCVL